MTETTINAPLKRMLLVLGENHKEIAAKYSENTDNAVENILFHQDDADKALSDAIASIKATLNSNPNTDDQSLLAILETMDADKFIETVVWNGAVLNEQGYYVEYTYPNAKYSNELCGQSALEKTGEFAGIGLPFILKNGDEAFVARKGDIDWNSIHMANADTEDYETVWELCREGRKPENETEQRLYDYFKNREYLSQFKNKEEFVKHNCCFWCYGVVDEEECILRTDINCSDLVWKSEFYKNFIEPLDDDVVLALYSANVSIS